MTHTRRTTNADGRCLDLLEPYSTSAETRELLKPGLYKVVFKIKDYFESKGQKCFYPWVEVCSYSPSLYSPIHSSNHPHSLCPYHPFFYDKRERELTSAEQITFELENPEEHYHIPLLISPYSFTTYRGS